jgi:hypothetical protein
MATVCVSVRELTAERDQAYSRYLSVERALRNVRNVGPIEREPFLSAQARRLWSDYDALRARVERARREDIEGER